MMVYLLIEQLISQVISAGLIKERDRIYCRNQILGLLKMESFEEPVLTKTDKTIPQLLTEIVEYAITKQVITRALDDRDQLKAQIMNVFLPSPSAVNDQFNSLYQQDPIKATDFFYHFSQTSHYIQTERIAKNIHFQSDTDYGKIDITINLSKPEKDPLQIKREREMKQTSHYPTCLLCSENEGYVGRIGHPARSNHRMIDLNLLGEDWYFQYSPYLYYHEHSIVLCKEHQPMVISKTTFARLFAFVKQFPHYFIGSNADLPIVGGSILSHDHYQAGQYTFGMTDAKDAYQFKLDDYPTIDASVLNWPMSVIRLRAQDTDQLVEAGGEILAKWREYSDPVVDLVAFTDKTPHNTITPIAQFRNGRYQLDLVLRNNRTSSEHPEGIFHPHQDVHHIKKENIGLIEVMGLAVLPPRLKDELKDLKHYLLGEVNQIEAYHQPWANEIKLEYKQLTRDNIDQVIEQELSNKFIKILKDSGIFKDDSRGWQAFKRFTSSLNK